MNKLYVVGIGPGSKENMTFKAVDAIKEADTIVAYTKYLAYVEDFINGKEIIKTGMTGEKERCQLAIDEYKKDKTVAIISTGDSGLYGMAGLVYEIDPSINIEVVPGAVSYTHLRAHETGRNLVCRLLLEKKKKKKNELKIYI